MRILSALLLAAFCVPASAGAAKTTLAVAAAANLADCIAVIDTAFEQASPDTQLRLSTGASGNFFAQIENGAPFDVFVSADTGFPQRLADEGYARRDSLRVYAYGRLALWTLRSDLDVSRGVAALADVKVTRIAIANPDVAPYGAAARTWLQRAGAWDALAAKLVQGENIAQAVQFVQTGNADAGLVALSLLYAPATRGLGEKWVLPDDAYPSLAQAAVITTHGAGNPLAARYLDFLGSKAARAVFESYGYRLPEAPQH